MPTVWLTIMLPSGGGEGRWGGEGEGEGEGGRGESPPTNITLG